MVHGKKMYCDCGGVLVYNDLKIGYVVYKCVKCGREKHVKVSPPTRK